MTDGVTSLGLLNRVAEELLGNRLGAGVYRDWVASLGLRGDENLLEVGTGAGACARHLAAALPDGQLTCVEVDARWLEIARGRLRPFGDRARFVEADIAGWSRPAEFDAAVIHFVLHDIPAARRQTAADSVVASLRPGGRLYVREPVTHGMSGAEMAVLMHDAGLRRAGADAPGSVPLMGATLGATWEKPASGSPVCSDCRAAVESRD